VDDRCARAWLIGLALSGIGPVTAMWDSTADGIA
jgi:hypothetical protein